VKTDNHLYLYI